jgi:hypothetical protein
VDYHYVRIRALNIIIFLIKLWSSSMSAEQIGTSDSFRGNSDEFSAVDATDNLDVPSEDSSDFVDTVGDGEVLSFNGGITDAPYGKSDRSYDFDFSNLENIDVRLDGNPTGGTPDTVGNGEVLSFNGGITDAPYGKSDRSYDFDFSNSEKIDLRLDGNPTGGVPDTVGNGEVGYYRA